jgi:hypothetical protein
MSFASLDSSENRSSVCWVCPLASVFVFASTWSTPIACGLCPARAREIEFMNDSIDCCNLISRGPALTARGWRQQLAAHLRAVESACAAARSKYHTLAQSHLEPGRAPTVSVPAAARPHCILHARNLGTLAFCNRLNSDFICDHREIFCYQKFRIGAGDPRRSCQHSSCSSTALPFCSLPPHRAVKVSSDVRPTQC